MLMLRAWSALGLLSRREATPPPASVLYRTSCNDRFYVGERNHLAMNPHPITASDMYVHVQGLRIRDKVNPFTKGILKAERGHTTPHTACTDGQNAFPFKAVPAHHPIPAIQILF